MPNTEKTNNDTTNITPDMLQNALKVARNLSKGREDAGDLLDAVLKAKTKDEITNLFDKYTQIDFKPREISQKVYGETIDRYNNAADELRQSNMVNQLLMEAASVVAAIKVIVEHSMTDDALGDMGVMMRIEALSDSIKSEYTTTKTTIKKSDKEVV